MTNSLDILDEMHPMDRVHFSIFASICLRYFGKTLLYLVSIDGEAKSDQL